jgi:serine/threonine protein kinase
MIGTELLNFRILEQLGEGGMGVVYKGVDTSLDRLVAIKVLNSDLSRNPELVERFRAEARAQANLNHTNIATLYAFVAQGGQAWMVMEYIEGETISHMLERRGLLPPDVAVPLFKQALLGIGWAHRMGIVHRDIKPSNLMVNKQGIVKVMDFGIAKVLGSGRGLTRTGTALGTAYYMSPEQVMNKPVDIRSDIYSLGVTLYEMLTANVPFQGESDFHVMTAHVNVPPPAPTRYYPYIPRGVENAVLKAMAKDPAGRFQTVEEFGAALEHPDDFGITWGVQTPAVPPPPLPPPSPSPNLAEPVMPARPATPPPVKKPVNGQTGPTVPLTVPGLPPPSTAGMVSPQPAPPPAPALPHSGGIYGKWISGAAALVLLATVGIYQFRKPHPEERHDVPAGGATVAQNEKKETHEVEVWPPPNTNNSEAPAELKIVEFGTDTRRVQPGQAARLHWSVQGASHVTITPDIGDVDAKGSKDVIVQRTTEFQLSATKLTGGEVHQTVTVEVGPAAPPAARRLEVEFDAQPDAIVRGQTARLRWAVPGADQVTITPEIGSVRPVGTVAVRPAATTTYRLQAQAGSATAAREVTVQVQEPQKAPPPAAPARPEISFQATPPSIPQGSSATLSWNLRNAVAANILPQPGVLRQASGQVTVTPATTTTYTLTARSKDGLTESASATVQVMAPKIPGPGPSNAPPPRSSTSMIMVVHDHGGAMNASTWPSCFGALQVVNGVLRYAATGSVDGRVDSFEVPISQVQEVKVNRLRIKNQPAFHMTIQGRHLNFVATSMPATQAAAELEAALTGR